MVRGLGKLTWLEIKIFVREPLGFVGTVAIPVLVFVLLGRTIGGGSRARDEEAAAFVSVTLPVLASILIALSAVMSLVTIVAIYREGGILKRLRATPLRSHTILTAHVLVKLLFTAITVIFMFMAGRRYYPVSLDVPLVGFTFALLLATLSILSVGFVIASVVPTARFAQPIGSLILYPMVALSGLFYPIDQLPSALKVMARLLPLTYAVSLLRGILTGGEWSAHLGDVTALAVFFVVCTVVSAKVFRWE
jgi:ABC-2 type transport system permease protein